MLHPLATTTWGEEELKAAHAVIDGGQLTMGAVVQQFEAAFAAQFGARHAVMVNSGSSANLLAVAALFFSENPPARGSVAIAPAVSWATTYYPLSQYGLKLRFVDIDPATLNFDLDALARAVDDDVSVIFAVNLLGNPNDYDAVKAIIGDRPIRLIEDNCESMGAAFNGRQAGTFGEIGTFSTYFSHHISTVEGGVCVTDSDELYELLLCLRSHGWTRHLPADSPLTKGQTRGDFYDLFRFILPGYNLRPTEIAAAIGIEQLKKLPGFVAERRRNAAEFVRLFSDLPGLSIQREVGQSSWFGFAMVLDPAAGISRQTMIDALSAAGVETRPVVAGNFVRNPVIQHLDHDISGELVHADRVHDWGFYIGNHQWDVRPELAQVRQIIGAVLAR